MHKKRFNLPPLDLIQGFEAAARNLSFTKAAEELFITQSAVSRQIRSLEEHLGVTLFERRPRSLQLTEQGSVLLRAAGDLLERLQEVTDRLRAKSGVSHLTVTTTNGFASLWLIPRLRGFTALNPDVDVRISATYKALNLERDLIDVAVRYGREDAAPAGAVRLFGEELFPICSPAIGRETGAPLRTLQDLAKHTLLFIDEPGPPRTWYDWATWLAGQGLPDLKPAGTLHFNSYEQMIQAALSGQGVGMGIGRLVSRLLETGQLVAPFRDTITAGPRAYYVIRSSVTGSRPHVDAFVKWLVSEAAAVTPPETRQALSSRPRAAKSGVAGQRARSRT
jgi:DNA-binding transcriptional LysR family regulator